MDNKTAERVECLIALCQLLLMLLVLAVIPAFFLSLLGG